MCHFTSIGVFVSSRQNKTRFLVYFYGTKTQFQQYLDLPGFKALLGVPSAYVSQFGEFDWTNFLLNITNFDGPSAVWGPDNLTVAGAIAYDLRTRAPYTATSFSFNASIPAGIDSTYPFLFGLATSLYSQPNPGFAQFRAYGATASQLPPGPTAWPHREQTVDIQLYGFGVEGPQSQNDGSEWVWQW